MGDVTETERGIQEAFRIDEAKIRGHVDQVVRQSVEQTLNQLLDAEADALCGALRAVTVGDLFGFFKDAGHATGE